MKIVLQRTDGEFFAGNGSWCQSISEARGFENSAAALTFALANRLHPCTILYAFSDSRFNLAFAVDPGGEVQKQSGRSKPVRVRVEES